MIQNRIGCASRVVKREPTERRQIETAKQRPELGEDRGLFACVGHHHVGRLERDGLGEDGEHVCDPDQVRRKVQVHATGSLVSRRRQRVVPVRDQDPRAVAGLASRDGGRRSSAGGRDGLAGLQASRSPSVERSYRHLAD